MPPPAKRRTKLVQFQQMTVDKSGEYDVDVWANVSDAWVSLSPDRGREVMTQGELVATVMYSVRGDYRDLEGVTEAMRMIYNISQTYPAAGDVDPMPADTKAFEIQAIMPDEEFEDDIMLKVTLRNRKLSDIG